MTPQDPTPESGTEPDELSLDALIASYQQAIRDEKHDLVHLYAGQLLSASADPAEAAKVESAFDYPFDKGIPKYRSTRWEAVRLGTYPTGSVQGAVSKRLLQPSQINHDQRRALGFHMSQTALERSGM